ncbi:5'/3'-nucleotidase SurE [Emergomyces pasteurianus Ep9510]|uniref:5'/3'-nucleotidase SurE n=1 Tax=Emergomyces pasteurianus Ep9510 TaxID=1447872 RepID=A0A1J9QD26_9EURO|nr:5'/3'-nucleotidase SurE [Emergomyces pasteurianus Ep9510]
MHILVVNDDGPPSNQSSPYVHSLVHTLESAGHVVSVVLPHRQRSWIGKAHLVGATVKPTYFRPGTLHKDDGTIHHLPRGSDGENDSKEPGGNEWILIDSTPASCVQIGLFHYFKDRGPINLVISGPNYGRNSTAVFALSSGTIGGALEAAVCGYKAIALSYAFSSRDHDPIVIAEASRHSVRLIGHLYENWEENVDFYSINVPLELGVSDSKILYTNVLDNRWTSGSCFEAIDAEQSGEGPDLQEQKLRQAGEVDAGIGKGNGMGTGTTTPGHRHMHFKWAPKFSDVYKSVELSPPGNDGWAVKEGITSVTRLKANFMHSPGASGEIQLPVKKPIFYALVECQDSYVQPLVTQALRARLDGTPYELIYSLCELPEPSCPLLQYRVYEQCDFEHVLSHPTTSLVNAYVIRKALIRKHYLSNTVANWVAKHPASIIKTHFKPAVDFELDYAEFLDEALVEAYELQESFEANEEKDEAEKEWWILKPGMSDRGQGIRLFNSESALREIFEEWEDDQSDSEGSGDGEERDDDANTRELLDDDDNCDGKNGIITSQLRHFIAQPYIHPPLLLPSESNRKFHIRTYVLAVGSLQVYVYREMLALFAEKPYLPPWHSSGATVNDLTRHLTNTCLQTGSDGATKRNAVRSFWALDDTAMPSLSTSSSLTIGNSGCSTGWKENVYEQICAVTGEIFEAAARGMLVHFQTLPNAFEVFGVDFLVDSSGKAWLLELNAFPDFRQTGDELKEDVVGRLFEAVMEVAVKPFFGVEDIERARERGEQLGLRLVRDLNMGMKR